MLTEGICDEGNHTCIGIRFWRVQRARDAGRLTNGKLTLTEVHRFSNDPVILNGRFVWDVPRLFFEMKQALVKVAKMGVKLDGIGVDTWGVDLACWTKMAIWSRCRCIIATT